VTLSSPSRLIACYLRLSRRVIRRPALRTRVVVYGAGFIPHLAHGAIGFAPIGAGSSG
jgi:hypothetical protein